MAESKYKERLVSGSVWISISEAITAIAQLASSIVAARVLAPHEIGLMGIVLLTIAVLESLSKTGFDQALIQSDDDVEPYLNVAWTWHVLRGFSLAALIAIAAPFVADFYDEPLVKWLIWVSAAKIVLDGLQNIGVIYFNRDLDFKTVCLVNGLKATAHAGVAIPAIVYFENVWGLVVGLVASALVGMIVTYIVQPFRPKLEWDIEKLKTLVGYGRWITGLTIILFVITQGDDIFVSKYLGPAALAFYQLAYSLSNLPATKITHVISQVSFATYARVKGEPEALRAAFHGVMRTTVLLSGPLGVAIWMVTPGIVEHVIGDKWAPVIPLVRILVVSAFIRSVAALGGALFRACERPDLDFKMNLPRFVAVVTLIYPFTAKWGLEGASYVVLIAIATTMPVFFYGVHKLVGMNFVAILKANLLALVSSSILLGCFYLVEFATAPLPGLAQFIVYALGSVVAWLGLMWVLGRFTSLDLFGDIARLRSKS